MKKKPVISETISGEQPNSQDAKNTTVEKEVESDKTAPVSMDDLTDSEVFPEPQPHAIEAIKKEREKEAMPGAASGAPSPGKDVFNPEFHATDKDGNPIKNKDGSYRFKNGRKKGFSPQKSVLNAPQPTPVVDMQSRHAANVVSGLFEQTTIKLIGEEWRLSDDERRSNVQAWEDTFNHYGGVKLSPPQALMLNQGAIILTRVAMPKTKSKLSLGYAWLRTKMTRNKTPKKDDDKNALSDNRKDAIGKNDIREEEKPVTTENGDKYYNPRSVS